jgi:hypothetical protein
VGAQVIVANHDLLLSSLGARVLPELDNCLLVLDEAHHLPATALAQFACSMDLSRITWIERLSSRGLRIGALLEVEEIADIPRHAAQLRQTLQDLARIVMDVYGDHLKSQKDTWGPARVRVPRGELPEPLIAPLGLLAASADGFLEALRAISKALRAEMRDKPDEAKRLSTLYAQIGMLAPRLEELHATAQLLLQDAPRRRRPQLCARRQVVHAGGGWRLHRGQGARQPHLARHHAAQPPVERGARRGADIGHAHQLRQFRFLLARRPACTATKPPPRWRWPAPSTTPRRAR